MSSQDQEATLTLKDRINFPYILANQILTFQKAILSQDFSLPEIRTTIESFVHILPDNWKEGDKKWKKEYKKAQITVEKDVRPFVRCNVRMSPKACERLGIPSIQKIETFDHLKLMQACINLLDRRGLITKKRFTEKMTGKPFEGEGPDIAEADIEEL